MKIKKLSEEHKNKISEALKGREKSEETKMKLSKAMKGRKGKKGSEHTRWKGGRFKNRTSGYVWIYKPEHPHANKCGYIREHRFVVEQNLGRYLLPMEVVHHIDGVRDNNRIENLILFASKAEHTKYHQVTEKIEKSCTICGAKHFAFGLCNKHYQKVRRAQRKALL